jgi:uncharacterized membrane protein
MADETPDRGTWPARLVRWLLAALLVTAGVGHLVAPEEFLAQTPTWLPARELIVLVSGLVEIALGLALLLARRRRREVGLAVAVFFVLILPGNVHQAVEGIDAFGLDSPQARWGRLLLQPVLVLAALWATRRPRATSPRGTGPPAD